MKTLLIVLFMLVNFSVPAQTPETNPTDREIRAALCEIENGNFAGAEKRLENILQKEPQNIFARRLLPGALARQIKKDDRSAANVGRIRKAIAAYRNFAREAEISTKEKAAADNFVITLLEKISPQEMTAELLKMAADETSPPESRARYYTSLAAPQYACANEIVAQTRKANISEIEKAKSCLVKGLEYTNRAVALDAASDSAWSYHASLLFLSAKIADREKDPAQKAASVKEAEAALGKYKEISKQKRAEEDMQPQPQEKPLELQTASQELISYKFEKPLERLVKGIDIPFELNSLIAPVPVDGAQTESKKNAKSFVKTTPQNAWKPFSSAPDEFSAELPANVRATDTGELTIYDAQDGKVNFTIIAQPRAAIQTAEYSETVLNTLAWAITLPTRNFSLMGDSPATFEVNFVRKESLAGNPGRLYAFAVNSCAGRTDGVIVVLIGKNRNYAIRITGADEQDARAQRFLKSLKF